MKTLFFAQPHARPHLTELSTAQRIFDFNAHFYLMGVLNITPDSFSDGGQFFDPDQAVAHGLAMAQAGADMIDIGGESTRPGAAPISADQECARVIPVIKALSDAFAQNPERPTPIISIDTSKAAVADAALNAGAQIVNDISGLGFDPDMPAVVARHQAALILMHIRGTPRTMQTDTNYNDLIKEIHDYFSQRIALAQNAGVARERIILDVGIGFGKSVAQNYQLVRELYRFFDLELPILLGPSRKSFLGHILDKPADQRLFGSAAAVACGLMAGANIVRVHDVEAMHDVLRITEAIAGCPI